MKKLSLRCISVIMALLFAFAPLSSAFAIKIPGLITYPTEKEIAETLGGYLKARDVDGIVGMFSEKAKHEIDDLEQKVQNLLNEIDCDIDNYSYSGTGGSDMSNYGYYHKNVGIGLRIIAEDKIYYVGVSYIQAWTDDEQRVGMSGLWLNLHDSNGNLIDYCVDIEIPGKMELFYNESERCYIVGSSWKQTHQSMGYNKLIATSSDEAVATVDDNGVVTATGRGTARITIKYVNETTGKELEYLYDVTVTFTTWQKIIWFLFFGFLWY